MTVESWCICCPNPLSTTKAKLWCDHDSNALKDSNLYPIWMPCPRPVNIQLLIENKDDDQTALLISDDPSPCADWSCLAAYSRVFVVCWAGEDNLIEILYGGTRMRFEKTATWFTEVCFVAAVMTEKNLDIYFSLLDPPNRERLIEVATGCAADFWSLDGKFSVITLKGKTLCRAGARALLLEAGSPAG
jgi:hypothetical protein